MKKYALIGLAMAFGLQTAYAGHPTVTKKKIHKEPLMASHLPAALAKNLSGTDSLSYVSGHTFYDTSVALLDENGKKISFRHQLDPQKHYTLASTGQTQQTANNIWFFSPEGADPQDVSMDACTAENPCKKFTQRLIDGIDQLAPKAKLWAASGDYQLPIANQKNSHPLLLELHNQQDLMGRTADFRHFAYGMERPLFQGTLSWNDYSGHGGVWSYVESIRSQVADNVAQVEDFYVNNNLHSTGSLYISNSDLENNSTQDSGSNVYAENISVYQSSLKGQSNIQGKNIYVYLASLKGAGNNSRNIEGRDVYVERSTLKMKGDYASNITAQGYGVLVFESTVSLESDTCYSFPAISLFDGERIYLASIKLDVKSAGECSEDSYRWASAVELAGSNPDSSNEPWIAIASAKIKVSSQHGAAFAVASDTASIWLNGAKITVQSLQDVATGIIGLGNNMVEFFERPSVLSVNSPLAATFFDSIATLSNNTNPPSQCVMNGGDSQDCQLF